MAVAVENAPRLTVDDAVRIAREIYGLEAAAEPLESERDQNFVLTDAGGEQYVLKIANGGESREILDLQNQAIHFLSSRVADLEFPQLIRTHNGEEIATVQGHFARLFTWVDGVCFATVKPHSRRLRASLGNALAQIDTALADFSHPAMQRSFHWDLRQAAMARPHLELIADRPRRHMVERFLARWQKIDWSRLRTSTIHGDANDYNILVSQQDSPERRVVSIVDFGDMVQSATVCDLAVALAYVMLDQPDPIGAAAEVVAAFHAAHPLTEAEVDVLYTLAVTRLCLSVCYAAWQSRQAPANEYLNISNGPAWMLLETLDLIPFEWPRYVFRHACAFPASPNGPRVLGWLRACDPAPVVHPDPCEAKTVVFDLSVSSPELESWVNLNDAALFTKMVFSRMREAGAEIGIGRYNEARRCYSGRQYEIPVNDGIEWRTVHIGLDLFQEAGAPVFAPLDGVVHSFANNTAPNDYGPTIIVEHEVFGVPFYTLFGHLSIESLDGLEIGRRVKKGERIATLGDIDVNGGWPPHLHFQIMLDTLERAGEFPGVAAPSQRALWLDLCPDPNLLVRIPEDRLPAAGRADQELLASRRTHLGPSLSISYRSPLHIVRGWRQYLYDAEGREYLDCVNNVAHVGHSHPRVVEAARRQMAVLNTNTRYLHENLVEYIERLAATLPEPLRVVYLVCSGSEANELALRLARAHTHRQEAIVVDAAYHGNTNALIDLSPYKFDGPGGRGKPVWVHKAPVPDTFRGPHRGADAGSRYAESVAEAARSSRGLAAFFCESALGCGGQIVLPDGYLRDAYAAVRESGGVCVADEVQTGFGRAGTHFWTFETQGVVPDIVTLGKPIGNGHPMGAVITTPEIASSFANGMEYFNTFGGNPVSCAVGLAVLDVVRDEGLQENARRAGEYLLGELRGLQARHPLIGDVRGLGLFIGIELVRNLATLEPANYEASYLVERMKERGVLLSTDGPFHNAIKIKPPLVFSREDADRLVRNLDVVLEEDYLRAAGFTGRRAARAR